MNNKNTITFAPLVFEKGFQISYHELDNHGDIKTLALLNYLQDSAGLHATGLGVSVTRLRESGLTWVLSRMHIIIDRYQRASENILVRTWPSSRKGIFTCREFELSDYSGSVTCRGTTSWAVLNIETRRPVRIESNLPHYDTLDRRAIDDPFATLPVIEDGAECTELSFRVLRGDLDINQHVNNAVYAGWALETVPDEVAAGRLTALEITYRAEAFYGESILSRCQVLECGERVCCLHQILNRNDGRELVRLRTFWQPERNQS